MKSLLVVLATAGAVVGLYFLLSDRGVEGSFLRGVDLDRQDLRAGVAATGESVIRELPGVWPRQGPTSVVTGIPTTSKASEVTRTRVNKLLGLAKGRDVLRIDRGQMTRALWEIERNLGSEDVAYLLQAWEENEDPSFRWSLSWLFERIKDDRMVAALETLLEDHPRRATDAIASVATPHAFERLVDRLPYLQDRTVRAHAMTRIGQSRWEGADDFLQRTWRDKTQDEAQRYAAVAALANRIESEEAGKLALDLALGPAQPVRVEGELAQRYPGRDLRDPAIMAVMRLGDQASVLGLIERADGQGAEAAFTRMVDRNLAGYRGPDISRIVFERIAARGFVSEGEAAYLVRSANRDDVAHLERLRDSTADPKVRKMLDAAAIAARER